MNNEKSSNSKLKWSKPEYKMVTREELKTIVSSGACSTLTLPGCQALFR